MQANTKPRRSYGSGSIVTRGGNYFGKWRVGDRQVMRKLGPVRKVGTREGLTKAQAEARLRKMISEVKYIAPEERLTFGEVANRYIDHVEHVMGRKPSTVHDYRIIARRHLTPYFGSKTIGRITSDDISAYLTVKSRQGLSPKTISNHVTFAHGVFGFALKRGLTVSNPVAAVDRPRSAGPNPDFRFLDAEEFDALLRAVPDDHLGPTDCAAYLTAAMTGLRQGELVALRWRDVDWVAGVIRVRRTYTRSQWGTPKSRRSSRAVPMADRVATELERHFQRSAFQADDDLVLPHPQTGNPYDASKMRKRFYDTMRAAGLGDLVGQANGITFHSLRHTYGTRMAAAGTPMRTLQEWMGHRSVQTTEIYADFLPDQALGRALTERAFGAVTAPHGPTASRPAQEQPPPPGIEESAGADRP
jgi:integrase